MARPDSAWQNWVPLCEAGGTCGSAGNRLFDGTDGEMRVCVGCGGVFPGPDWQCPICRFTPPCRHGYVSFAPDPSEETGGFRAAFFADLAKLEEKHFWFSSRNRLIAWAIQSCFPTASSLLEIGTGTGVVLSNIKRVFPRLQLTASDVFTEALDFARQRVPDVPLLQMDARNIPFLEEFDLVGGFDLLEHIEEDEQVLRQMFRACKQGGGILLTVPQHQLLWSALDDYSFHKRRFSRRELIRKVTAAGFNVLRITGFVSLFFPVLVVSRMRKRRMGPAFDPHAELTIPPRLNRVAGRVMDVERRFIEMGVRFPFGGSLLLSAKRC